MYNIRMSQQIHTNIPSTQIYDPTIPQILKNKAQLGRVAGNRRNLRDTCTSGIKVQGILIK